MNIAHWKSLIEQGKKQKFGKERKLQAKIDPRESLFYVGKYVGKPSEST